MKKSFFLASCLCFNLAVFAQDAATADQLVNEGVTLHDKGDYKGAIAKYDKALAADQDNLNALAEKAFSLNSLQQFEESIKMCEQAVEKHPGHTDLKNVYATWGNALDALKRPDESVEVYNEGIALFPDFYMLHFNKGITLTMQQQLAEAMVSFKNSLKFNPNHPGSHNAVARVAHMQDKKIPALLAYMRFLAIEPEGYRAKENFKNLRMILDGDVETKGKKSTITINVGDLADTLPNGKMKEDNFATIELIFALGAGIQEDKKMRKFSEQERLAMRLSMLAGSLSEGREKNSGFFWEYYAPYFIEMSDKKLMTTFCYIMYASTGDADVNKWLKSHQTELNEFFEWSEAYAWPGN